jgi:serine/threonine protein phosphatase PrpC
MRTLTTILAAAGATDPGRLRDVNEDRFHVDEARGLFMVVDGIGGQAAGGKAADVALAMLRERLERETGPVGDRVREAIAIANNEIYRLASTRPEWNGMACVLTIAVVKDGVATIGHVGDTRLYKLHGGRIEKITRDHSPVGEREDANEISELDAMRHPRRNEVYRDVGSEPHAPSDPDFVELHKIPFDPDEALLLCSDGLTDLVDSATILRTVNDAAGDPNAVVRALVAAAISAGGKDNVTAVFVDGGTFAGEATSRIAGPQQHVAEPSPDAPQPRQPAAVSAAGRSGASTTPRQLGLATAIVVSLIMTGFIVYRTAIPLSLADSPIADLSISNTAQIVHAGESIAAALTRAQPGSEVVVEPGEYQEHLTIKDHVRLVSRVPRGATIRLPATASDAQTAIVASGSSGEIAGFRIVGDARTPLGVGILVSGHFVSLIDVEISGASTAAISFARNSSATLLGSDIHDNAAAALAIEAGASPRITHNTFSRNGLLPRTPETFVIERGAKPLFERNIFGGVHPDVFANLDEAARAAIARENWFPTQNKP